MMTDRQIFSDVVRALAEVEKSMSYGDSIAVQPRLLGNEPHPFTLATYSAEQLDHHLKEAVRRSRVNGSEISVGIMFAGLTDAGHRMIV